MKNLSLIGMPGSGKSTLGVLLAKAIGYDFLDTDILLQSREGKLLQPMVDEWGVSGFLDAEERAILSLDCQDCVISPGGSVVCRESMIQHLKTLGPVVYLHVPLPELQRRVKNLSTRGIAMEPHESLEDVLEKRAPLYQEYADLIVSAEAGESPEDLVQKLILSLHTQGYLKTP